MLVRTRLDPVADPSLIERFYPAAMDIYRRGRSSLGRILRVRRDRAWLDDLPDYLLRDVGIQRSEISSVTRLGRTDGRRPRV
jgi:uncharacterized protein YjiS (DUF1127 family)